MAIKEIKVIGKNGQFENDVIMAKYLGESDNNYTYSSLKEKLDTLATSAWVEEFVSDAVGDLNSEISTFAGAMIFKGTLGTNGNVTSLPAIHEVGWTYRVITAGTWAGIKCEIGDMITCITKGTSANNAHWTVYQSNIDGAVTGPAAAVNNRIPLFNGTTGKIIKDSGYAIGDLQYSAGTGLDLSGNEFSIKALHDGGSFGQGVGGPGQSVDFGDSIYIPFVTYNAQGQITGATTYTTTLPELAMPVNPTSAEISAMPDGAFYLVI